jgi:hypothetical protein
MGAGSSGLGGEKRAVGTAAGGKGGVEPHPVYGALKEVGNTGKSEGTGTASRMATASQGKRKLSGVKPDGNSKGKDGDGKFKQARINDMFTAKALAGPRK